MRKVWVVDDDEEMAHAIGLMLKLLDCEVILFPSARSAAQILLTGRAPELLILDINMPGVNGTEILAYLRREPKLIPIPVFVVTSDDQPETRRKVMKLGATAMIIKPATIDVLENALKKARIL